MYLAPFALFFLGYFLTAALGMTEGVSAACGGIGFAAGVVLAILLDRHVRKRRGISFRITAIEPAA